MKFMIAELNHLTGTHSGHLTERESGITVLSLKLTDQFYSPAIVDYTYVLIMLMKVSVILKAV